MSTSDEAKVEMCVYGELSDEDATRLKRIDLQVGGVVLRKAGTCERPMWTSREDDQQRWFVRLTVGSGPRVLMEIPSEEARTIGDQELLQRLENGIS